jgi:uncharacterized membrane protein
MTRQDFLDRLRAGLRGLSSHAVNDIVADYDAHFAEGAAAGRTEAQVAEALGDPHRLARELRAEANIKRWEEEKNPAAALGAIVALLGLGAIDLFILLPILVFVIGLLVSLYAAAVALLLGGAAVAIFGPFASSSAIAVILLGVGLMAAAICGLAVLTLISVGLVNALIRYGRLHFRLLTPALPSKGDRA